MTNSNLISSWQELSSDKDQQARLHNLDIIRVHTVMNSLGAVHSAVTHHHAAVLTSAGALLPHHAGTGKDPDCDYSTAPMPADGSPVDVRFRFLVEHVSDINDVSSSAWVKIVLGLYWTDPRVKGYEDGQALPDDLWGPLPVLTNGMHLEVEPYEFSVCDTSVGRLKRLVRYSGNIVNPVCPPFIKLLTKSTLSARSQHDPPGGRWTFGSSPSTWTHWTSTSTRTGALSRHLGTPGRAPWLSRARTSSRL